MNRALLAVPVAALAVAGTLIVTAGGGGTPPARAADTTSSSSDEGVVVDGVGRVTGTPDVLRATLGVSLRRGDVSSALQDANKLQTSVRESLRRNGVAVADLQTSDVSIYPSYDNKGKPNGYQVSETLTAKLRNLEKAGKALTDAVNAGGNSATLQGVSFALEDNAALLAKARDAAFADAKSKAQRYADLAGVPLGALQLVTESVSEPSNPSPYASGATGAFDAARAAVPVDAGTSQLSVSVRVRWALR